MKNNFLWIILIIILITLIPSLGEEKLTLVFAGDYNFPPIEFLDPQGEPKGFAVDMVQELSKRINKKIEIRLVPWNKAVELLDSRKVDGVQFMRINEERKKKYDFVTYLESFSVIVVPFNSSIHNFLDLKDKRVGVLKLDVAHLFLSEMVKTIPCISSEDVLKKIISGEAEAGVINYYVAKWLINKNNWNDKLKILPDKLFTNYAGIALPKGSPYYSEIKKGISEIVNSSIYLEFLKKWFGEEIFLRLEVRRKEAVASWLIYLLTISLVILFGVLGSRAYLKKEVKRQTFEISKLLEENKRKYAELNIAYNFIKEVSNKDLEDIEKIFCEKLGNLFSEHRVKIYKRINGEFFLLFPQESKVFIKNKFEEIEALNVNKIYIPVEKKILYIICYEGDIPEGIFDLMVEEFKYTVETLAIQNRLEKEKELSEIVGLFQEKPEKVPILEALLRRVLDILEADAGSIMVYNEDEKVLRIIAGIGLPEDVIKNTVLRFGEGIAGWVAEHREPVILEDVYKDKRFVIIEPRFNIKSSICYPLIHKNKLVGVLNINSLREYRKFTYDHLNMVEKVAPVLASLLYKEELENRINKLNKESLLVLVELIDARDPYTGGHSREVRNIALSFGEFLGLQEEELRILEFAGYLHDIGKIKVPDFILKKPGKLSDEEYMIMKMHPVWGEEILQNISVFKNIGKFVRHHHERWDGKGYPDGLKGEEIPFYSRILTIADSFQAMTAYRPYKKRLSIDEAIEEIKRCKGSQFDPFLSEAFIELIMKEKVRYSN